MISSRNSKPIKEAFGKESYASSFSKTYCNSPALIPVRMSHGSIKPTLLWNRPLQSAKIPALLLLLFDGLREVKMPYSFLVGNALNELFKIESIHSLIDESLFAKLVVLLRGALTHPNKDVVLAGLSALKSLFSPKFAFDVAKPLGTLLSPLGKWLRSPQVGPMITSSLNSIECELKGNPLISKTIKSKIPTYHSIQ